MSLAAQSIMLEVQLMEVRLAFPPLCSLSDPCTALHCSCKAVGTTQKQLTVRQLPPVLCLHLKRFEVVAQAGSKAQVSGAHTGRPLQQAVSHQCIWEGMAWCE